MDKETIKEIAGASTEVAKTTSKALDQTSAVGSFIYKVVGEPIEIAAGTFLTDPLREFRTRRLAKLKENTERILSERQIDETRSVPPKFAAPLLEDASLEDDDELLELWANLLANAMDPSSASVEKRFINCLQNLSSNDAKLFSEVVQRTEGRSSMMVLDLQKSGFNRSDFENLVQLGVLQYPRVPAGTADGADYENGEMVYVELAFDIPDFEYIGLTSFGQSLASQLGL